MQSNVVHGSTSADTVMMPLHPNSICILQKVSITHSKHAKCDAKINFKKHSMWIYSPMAFVCGING